MKKLTISIILILSLLNAGSVVYAGGPLYSKPEFKGRIIDAETKQPIEGAVAVVLYDKRPLIGGLGSLGGVSSYVFHAKETLTDSKGEFRLPAYSSVLLFTEDTGVRFIFYKPGYMAGYGPTKISPTLIELYFSAGKVGEELEIEGGTFEQGSYTKWKGPLGIVELKKGERDPSTPSQYRSEELPLLFKALNEDRRNRGYKGELK
jgi:hypothetical protein